MKCLIKEKLSEHKYRDNNGYLICVDSVLARTGKQRYLRSEIFADAADDDSEIEVDRKPEEVFSEKTLASFENCPLCVEHPDEDVNPDNYKDYAVGFVRDVHKGNVDGQDVILGTLVITDGKTIEEVENGQHTDLSCGYDCDIEDSANPQQRNIRGNHVALCEQGRAGNARIVDSKKVKDSERYIIYRNSGAGEMIYEGSDLKDVIEEIKSLGRNYYIIDTKDGYKKITYSEAIKMKLDSVKDEDIFKVDVSSAEDRDVSRFITEAQNIGFITDDTGYIIYLKHGNRDMLNQLKARTHTINIKFFDSYNGYYDEKEKDNWNNGYAYYFEDDDDYYRALKQVKASGQKILATGVEAGPNGRQYFVLKDSIKDSKYIVHFKHKNGGGDKDIIVEAKGMADAVEIAKTYVSDFYYKYVNVKPYFEDSYKDYQSTKESFERIEEMPRTARKWVGETSNKKAGLLAIENGIEDIINSADPSIREELRRRGDKILRDIKTQFRIEDEESTYTEVTKELEKNYNNFVEKDLFDGQSDLLLLKEYFNERQPNKKMELRHKLREMNYKEGVSGVNSRELMWVELNGKKYEVKNLSSVTPLDSIKDSTFVIRYKDIKDEKIITITLEGKTYKAIYNGMSSRYPDMADVYIPELAVLNSKYTPADDLGNHPKDGKYYIRKERIHDAEELPHISIEKWNKIPSDYKTKDPVTGKRQAFAGSLGIAPGGTTLLTEGKHFIIDEITSKRDSVIKDEYPKLNSRQEQELRKYAQRFSYEMEEVYDGLNSRVNREGMSVDKAVEDLKETMVAQKSLYDSSIKDSVFTFNYKDLYHNESHKEDIKANTVEEAIEELKKRVALRGIGTANVWVVSISSETETYPRGYGKLNSLTVDSNKLKDSCKKDSLVNIIKVAKVVKKYGK